MTKTLSLAAQVLATAVVVAAITFGIPRACNTAFNNRTIVKPGYYAVTRATGFNGHKEYIRYTDGSQEIKVYPSLGHRTFGSKVYQDLDGDNLVDRIRNHGPEWKMHRMGELLIRGNDYQDHKSDFDKADQQLQELAAKYVK